MYRIKRKLLALALALVMCASLIGAAFLLDDSGSGSLTADSDSGLSLKEDNSLKLADTSSAFDSSIINIQPEVTGKQWLIISLDGKSLSYRSGNTPVNDYAETIDGQRAERELRKEQQNFLSELSSASIDYEYKYGYTLLTNAVAINVDVKYADRIADIDGVTAVDISEYYYAPKDTEVSNNANVWGTGIYKVPDEISENYNGSGIVAAVLDTGLDASHPAFTTNPSNKEALMTKEQVQERIFEGDSSSGLVSLDGEASVDDVYYSEKVPFAYDYADKDTDVYPAYSAHGTHVAGIIAGTEIDEPITDIDGNPILDSNGNEMTFRGVAPEAQLAICKVFSDQEDSGVIGGAEEMDILAALEDCVKLKVDIINMSLGSSAGFSTGDNEHMQKVYDAVREAGISLIVAASNDYSSSYGSTYGTNLTSNPDSATVGSPSTYPSALSVASINGQESSYIKTEVNGEDKFLYFTEASDGNNNEKDFVKEIIANLKSQTTPVTPTKDEDGNDVYAVAYQVVPGYGQSLNYKGLDVKGKIAVIRRGGNVSFEDKVRVAMQKGAIGCIIYNNVSGIIRMSLGNLSNPVPTCSITMDTANSFISSSKGTMYISEGFSAGPFMSDFSSWGPTPDLKLKPEISAHGGEITSSVPNGYAEYSGTSMASPNMAGAMSLIRSYVDKELSAEVKSDDLTHDTVAMSNFLVMSTATIANDEFNQPYSPRKQGAGLADITKVFNTQAYLYSEGIDKAKIEIGDDKKKTGEYTLTFHAKNMYDTPRTYVLGTKTMTETVSSDGMTVAERAYMLDSMTEVSFSGEGVEGNRITLGANADVVVTVKIKLNDEAKKYLDDNFENGMYVEGFVTMQDITGDGKEVDLNIPWLGFYGDWYSAPLFDISQYDLDAALADDSIPDDEKPEAAIYPTIPIGSYYNKQYVIPLGSYLYDQDGNDRHIYATSDKASISIYDSDSHRTISQLYGVYAGLLRGAAQIKTTITDAVTGEVVFEKTQKNIRKSFTGGSSSAHGSLVELDFNADELNLENNRQYLVHLEGVLDSISEDNAYDPSKYSYDKTFDFNFYVDTEAPEITDYRVRYETYKDENDKTRYSVYLDVDVYDNHYAQAIALCFADYSTMSLELLDNNMTPIYSTRNSVTTVTLDITDYYDQNIDLYLQVEDYALNARAYHLSNFKPLEDAVTYPDSIEIVTGSEAETPDEDYSKQVTINVNEALSLETLITPSDAASVNLFWHSFDEGVVRVKDGEIFGVAPGTALVKVYAGKDEYSGASDGILVTVTDEVNTAPGVTKLKLGLIENADGNLVDPTGTTVSVNPNEAFNLKVTMEPWYTSVTPDIRWRSSVPQVATVDETTGYVRTLTEGSAVITGTLYIDGKQTLYTVSTTLSVGPEFVVLNGYLREYHGPGGKVTIPKDLNVYYIYEDCFQNNTNITELEISAPCQEIQSFAFANMKSLERIVIPESMEYVYSYAFYGCENLKTIELHSRAVTFSDMCFAGCTSLETIQNIKLLNGLKAEDVEILDLTEGKDYTLTTANMTALGRQTFMGCTSLKELDLTQLRVAGEAAFMGCTSLEKVKLSRYTAVSDNMFYGCSKLSTLVYSDVTAAELDTISYGKAESPFEGCNITNIQFASQGSDGEIVIEYDSNGNFTAIYGDTAKTKLVKVAQNLTKFTVPASVTYIAPNAFSGNGKLTSVTFADGSALTEIGAYAFSGTGLKSIKLPATVNKIGNGAFSYCLSLTSADLSEFKGNVIPAEAFYNSALQSISFSDSITSVGARAFMHTALKSLNISGTNINTLGDSAFANCPYLKTVQLGAITSMGDGVFAIYSGYGSSVGAALTSVTFGEGSVQLGTNTFSGQYYLETLSLPEALVSLETLGEGVFYGCASLETVPFDALVYIGDYAFGGCASLESVTLSNVKQIGVAAFAGCKSLSVSNLPALETAGAQAFYGCEMVTSVTAPALTTLGDEAFVGSGLKSLSCPKIVTIGRYAFANTSLTGSEGALTIPETVVTIGEGAYSGLVNVTSFVIGENDNYFTENGILYQTVASGFQTIAFPAGAAGDIVIKDGTVRIGASAFENASKVTSVSFPYELKAIGDRAFYACSATKYIFGGITAPVLEAQTLSADDFEQGSELYKIFDRGGNIMSETYYANFKDYVALKIYAGRDGIKGIEDFKLTAVCPENATGFDGRYYAAYFSTVIRSELVKDDNARLAEQLIAKIPEADKVNALTSEDTATWKEYRTLVSAAREAFNTVSATQVDKFISALAEKLYATEAAMRAKASLFGENVTMQRITVSTQPAKTVYIRGDKFDPTGMVLTLEYSDGSREYITEGYTIVNGDIALTENNRTIAIRYGKGASGNPLSTSINVTVNKPALESFEFVSYPSQRTYKVGDTYVSAGLVLKLIYVDGIEETLYNGYKVSSEPLQEGENTITVTYGGITKTYVVTLSGGMLYNPGSEIPDTNPDDGDNPDTNPDTKPDQDDENKEGLTTGAIIGICAAAVVVVAAAAVTVVMVLKKKNK